MAHTKMYLCVLACGRYLTIIFGKCSKYKGGMMYKQVSLSSTILMLQYFLTKLYRSMIKLNIDVILTTFEK